jgi:Domain of unknown function (DUF222)
MLGCWPPAPATCPPPRRPRRSRCSWRRPEAGQTLLAALEPLARPASAEDDRRGGQRHADALTELARRALEAGRLPQTGGVRPQLLVTVDLHSLLGRPGAVGGEGGWTGPLDPEACRRLACDVR